MSRRIVAFKPNPVAAAFDDRLIFFNPYSNSFDEVPGGAPHGRGFTIDEIFHRVCEGQDITELVERVSSAGFFKKSAGISKRTTRLIGDPRDASKHAAIRKCNEHSCGKQRR